MIKKLIAVYDAQPFDKVYTASFFENCFKIILLLKSNYPKCEHPYSFSD